MEETEEKRGMVLTADQLNWPNVDLLCIESDMSASEMDWFHT